VNRARLEELTMSPRANSVFTPAQVAAALETRFLSNDLHKRVSLREYFKAQLAALWRESDSFSGKYPLGNSGWEWEIAIMLIKHGFIAAKLDHRGAGYDELEEWPAEADVLIRACIEAM
jgi:hypothetical protein